jgi:hypothetical protein
LDFAKGPARRGDLLDAVAELFGLEPGPRDDL